MILRNNTSGGSRQPCKQQSRIQMNKNNTNDVQLRYDGFAFRKSIDKSTNWIGEVLTNGLHAGWTRVSRSSTFSDCRCMASFVNGRLVISRIICHDRDWTLFPCRTEIFAERVQGKFQSAGISANVHGFHLCNAKINALGIPNSKAADSFFFHSVCVCRIKCLRSYAANDAYASIRSHANHSC